MKLIIISKSGKKQKKLLKVYDVYGCGRISSWGWGTWRDRWEQYSVDNNALKRLKEDKSRNLAVWENDLE